MTVTEAVQTCRSPAQIDDDEEEGGQCIEAEMRAKPRQSDRQGHFRGIRLANDQPVERARQGGDANRQAGAVNHE